MVSTYLKHSSQNGFIFPPSFGGTLLKPKWIETITSIPNQKCPFLPFSKPELFWGIFVGVVWVCSFKIAPYFSPFHWGEFPGPGGRFSAPLTAHKNFQLLAGRLSLGAKDKRWVGSPRVFPKKVTLFVKRHFFHLKQPSIFGGCVSFSWGLYILWI